VLDWAWGEEVFVAADLRYEQVARACALPLDGLGCYWRFHTTKGIKGVRTSECSPSKREIAVALPQQAVNAPAIVAGQVVNHALANLIP